MKRRIIVTVFAIATIVCCKNKPKTGSSEPISTKTNSPSVVIEKGQEMNLHEMLSPVPSFAKFEDESYYIWGASMVRDKEGKCHLFYSRWSKDKKFSAWVTHSEIAHAISNNPLGPYTHVDVAFQPRGTEYWDGLCTHNPTVQEFDGKYYLYYMGNTGNGAVYTKERGLNWLHRNNQRIGVAVAEHPNGPWTRFDKPLIDVGKTPNAHDALMVSNPGICRRPDNTYVLVYKAVGKERPLPFGGPVVHLVATSKSPTGPFVKHNTPQYTVPGEAFPAEDPFIWTQNNTLWAIVKDHSGNMAKEFTGGRKAMLLFKSEDGLQWEQAANPLVSFYEINWKDKGLEKIFRLERPQLWLDEYGEPAVLFCAATDSLYHSYNVHIPLLKKKKRLGARKGFENYDYNHPNYAFVADSKITIGKPIHCYQEPKIIDHSVIYNRKDKKWHMLGIYGDQSHFIHLSADSLTQENWEKKEDFKGPDAKSWAPHIITHNKQFWMFYTGIDKPNPRKINLSTSTDLFKWTHAPLNPMLAQTVGVSKANCKNKDPMVFKHEGLWIMYYSMVKDEKGNWAVSYSTSKDLVNWSKAKICFDENNLSPSVESPFVVRRGKYYYLMLASRPWGFSDGGVDIFRSTTPYNWKTSDKVKRISSWHAPEIVRDLDGKWYITDCGAQKDGFWVAPFDWNDGLDESDTSMPTPLLEGINRK